MKIAVTGAIGHIGSYVVRDLSVQFPGVEILMIDNMMTQRFSSLFNLPQTGRYRFVEADVTSADLRPLFAGADVVIHLAAITDAAGSFEKAALVEANNYSATVRVAQACAESGARLIGVSSTSVYGTQNAVVSEDCAPDELRPQSPYAVTKLKEEAMLTELFAARALKGILCRFGTIFGVSAGMRFHTAVNKFCWQAAMGQPLTIWRTAFDQKRPYLDLVDASRAISFIIQNEVFDGRIYNVLTQNATVRQIVDAIQELVPDLEMRFVDNPIMNQFSYEVSCARFTSQGFEFAGNLRRGIAETIGMLRHANAGEPGTASSPLTETAVPFTTL
jgi:UDP-glucose 4-epimerase